MYKKLLLATAGVYVAYLTASVLSERLYWALFIFRYSGFAYPSNEGAASDLFIYPSLVFTLACLICSIYGFVKSLYFKEKQSPIPLSEQIILGILYTVNALTTNYALLYITYPTQSLGRNLRYLSVIIVGAFFSKIPKSESAAKNVAIGKHKIVVGFLITIGVIAFNVMKFVIIWIKYRWINNLIQKIHLKLGKDTFCFWFQLFVILYLLIDKLTQKSNSAHHQIIYILVQISLDLCFLCCFR